MYLSQEYPEYYDVIKRPMDMVKIQSNINGKYETLDDIVSDFALVFDNACKFNEPESLIYRVSVSLANICTYVHVHIWIN